MMKLVEKQKEIIGSDEERRVLARAFFGLVNKWDLTRDQEAQLLGWTYQEKRTKLENMREGKTNLPQDRDKVERVIDLVNIHKSLRVLFPDDKELVYQWVKVPRERFGDFSALDVMLEDGKEGISAIRQYLDYERTR